MKIKNIKIKDVKKADYNPRQIDKNNFEKLKQSLKEFGCVKPLVINTQTGLLVSGHQTLDAARELGWDELPYYEVDLGPKKEKVLNIALNKLNEGGWDYDKLNGLLDEIKDMDVFECSGFDVSDVDLMEKLSDDGSLVSDEPAEEIKTPVYEIVFKFDNETDMIYAKKHFSNTRHGWKNTKELNSNLLKKVIENEKKNA